MDKNHLLSIEGPHWATDVSIFDELYDENMVLHFHRYAEPPEIACLEPYIKTGRKLGVPLWMGETGENTNAWYAALYPLAESLGIGYNLWPWKKMDCTNSPCSIKRPKGWEEILSYIEGGPHPGYARSAGIFCEYLENMKYENCIYNEAVTHHVFRRPPFSLQAVDFDCVVPELAFDNALPEKSVDSAALEQSFDSVEQTPDLSKMARTGDRSEADAFYGNLSDYRRRCGMEVIEQYKNRNAALLLTVGGNALRWFYIRAMRLLTLLIRQACVRKIKLTIAYEAKKQARLAAGGDVKELEDIVLQAGEGSCDVVLAVPKDSGKCRFLLQTIEGFVVLKTIDWKIC